MNFRRILTRKPVILATVVAVAALVIALVAIPAGAINQSPVQSGGGTVHNSPDPVPTMLNYQGYLADSDGDPINDTLEITFSIYEDAEGGTPIWQETQDVRVTDGMFNVLLGSINPISPDYLTGESYLGIQVGADPEMIPRQQIASVAYALRADKANDADTLDGMDSADFSTGDDVKQLIHDFTVASGESITAGDVVSFFDGYVQKTRLISPEYVFNPATTSNISATALSSTRFVVAYLDAGNNGYGTAVVGKVSGNTVTYGSEYVFNQGITRDISVDALSSTKCVVAYHDLSNNYFGSAIIGDVSDDTITFGSGYTFNPQSTWYISALALSSTKFVVAYSGVGGGTAIIGDVSGNAITFGSEYVFFSGGAYGMSTALLSPTKFVVAYRDGGNLDYGNAVIGDVSGNDITFGGERLFNSGGTFDISTIALSSNKFLMAYRDRGNSNYGTLVIGTVSGSTSTFGPEYVFNSEDSYNISLTLLSSGTFAVAYRDDGNSGCGTVVFGSVSNDIIQFGTKCIFSPYVTGEISAASLYSTRLLITYGDIGNSEYGKAVIGYIGTPALVGVAAESRTAGEMLPVIIHGVSDVHSGLVPGTIYYWDYIEGELTTIQTDYKVGLAISEDEILLSMPSP
jgi:hypothetical protein